MGCTNKPQSAKASKDRTHFAPATEAVGPINSRHFLGLGIFMPVHLPLNEHFVGCTAVQISPGVARRTDQV